MSQSQLSIRWCLTLAKALSKFMDVELRLPHCIEASHPWGKWYSYMVMEGAVKVILDTCSRSIMCKNMHSEGLCVIHETVKCLQRFYNNKKIPLLLLLLIIKIIIMFMLHDFSLSFCFFLWDIFTFPGPRCPPSLLMCHCAEWQMCRLCFHIHFLSTHLKCSGRVFMSRILGHHN